MEKVKKIISKLLSVLLALLVAICCIVMVKNAMGKEPSVLGCRFFYIVTGSMEPTIPVGSAVLVHKNSNNDYQVGDVITFKAAQQQIAGQPNTHRIIEKYEENGNTYYITRGDANNAADAEPVYAGDVYGKVIWTSGSMTWMGTFLGMLTTPLGFFSCIMIPIMVIAGIMVKDFTKAYKEAVDEEAREAFEAQQAAAQAQATAAQAQAAPPAEAAPAPQPEAAPAETVKTAAAPSAEAAPAPQPEAAPAETVKTAAAPSVEASQPEASQAEAPQTEASQPEASQAETK